MLHKYTLVPKGPIKNGTCEYSLDPKSGKVTFALKAKVKVLFFSKTIEQAGTTTVDAKQFLSANAKPGKTLVFGGLHVTIKSVTGQVAICELRYEDAKMKASGTAVLDLSQEYAVLKSLDAKGRAKGMDIPVILQKVK